MDRIKVQAADGSLVEYQLDPLSCGGVPVFEIDPGYLYRCDQCGAVIRSIEAPPECAKLQDQKKVWDALKKRGRLKEVRTWSDLS